jgi:hypothetical protein
MTAKTPTQTDFIKQSSIPAPLIRAVIKQLGGWESFQEKAPDITSYGMAGGIGGFIYYYPDTVPFSKKHKKHILELAEQQARDYGEADAFAMIAGFNCLKGLDLSPGRIATLALGREPKDDDGSADYTQIHNALAWYAGEEVARSYCDYLEYLND